jgi:hypothetical protein
MDRSRRSLNFGSCQTVPTAPSVSVTNFSGQMLPLCLAVRAYEEALRRIREAEETGAVELDLRGWKEEEYTGLETLNRLPPELASLTSLQSLILSDCGQLSDLSPLAGLASLQSLKLSGCYQLSDLSPLASLTSLQSLDLSGCRQLSGDLSPLVGLTALRTLNLSLCWELSGDLSPLAGLTSLQSLDLSWCHQPSDLSPLAGLALLQERQEIVERLCGRLDKDDWKVHPR